jgi:Ca2+-binding EF-hand superfamily protein
MNKKTKLTNLFPVSLLLILFSFVVACDDGNNDSISEEQQFIKDNFNAADTDGDGVIDEDEIVAEILKDFSDQDVDNDGEITENDHDFENDPEYKGVPVTEEERGELIHDLNQDGVVTQEEYVESVREQIVEPMDANNNGEITLEEALNFVPGIN